MDTNERIAQWEKMAKEAPDDMSFFSLGTAYRDAGRLEDADKALAEAIKLNPQMSRAYQLRAQVLIELDRKQEAGDLLTQGYPIAAKLGDVMPQKAMGSLLKKLKLPVPEVEAPKPAAPVGEDQIVDRRTGMTGTRLPDPPMRGPLGQLIYDQFSAETWREWIHQGTKVINELRLDFSIPEHQNVYDQQMMAWLGISQEEVDACATGDKGPGSSG